MVVSLYCCDKSMKHELYPVEYVEWHRCNLVLIIRLFVLSDQRREIESNLAFDYDMNRICSRTKNLFYPLRYEIINEITLFFYFNNGKMEESLFFATVFCYFAENKLYYSFKSVLC